MSYLVVGEFRAMQVTIECYEDDYDNRNAYHDDDRENIAATIECYPPCPVLEVQQCIEAEPQVIREEDDENVVP